MNDQTDKISLGSRFPEGEFKALNKNKIETISTAMVFNKRRVVLFGVPGAFTPTCSVKHLPGFVAQYDAIRRKGVDVIACMSVNDAYVMSAWARSSGANDKIVMLADGDADMTKILGLEHEIPGMGVRCRRFSMVVDDGRIVDFAIDDKGLANSSAESVLTRLSTM